MVRSTIIGFVLSIAASAAQGQEPRVTLKESFADMAKRQAEMMRISIGMNFMLAGIGDPLADDAKLRERTRRNVYQIAMRECDMILEMLASECRVESVNINLNRNPQIPDSVNVNANITLRAVAK